MQSSGHGINNSNGFNLTPESAHHYAFGLPFAKGNNTHAPQQATHAGVNPPSSARNNGIGLSNRSSSAHVASVANNTTGLPATASPSPLAAPPTNSSSHSHQQQRGGTVVGTVIEMDSISGSVGEHNSRINDSPSTTTTTTPAAITNATIGMTSDEFVYTLPNLPPHKYTIANIGSRMPHMTYKVSEIEEIVTTNRKPQCCGDRMALGMVKLVGMILNFITRFDSSTPGVMSKERWVSRAVFLESVAGVPGMIAAMVRHLNSLRRMKRDHGWVRHLLEEADNERMHLFFFLREKNPSVMFRIFVWLTQAGFLVMNLVAFMISPKTMHRFVGYLEEEAVKTYNCMVDDIDSPNGTLREWRTKPAPKDMAAYYCLDTQTATFRDIILCIRADETGHREHNHMFSDLYGESTEQFIPREELEMAHFPLAKHDPSSFDVRAGGLYQRDIVSTQTTKKSVLPQSSGTVQYNSQPTNWFATPSHTPVAGNPTAAGCSYLTLDAPPFPTSGQQQRIRSPSTCTSPFLVPANKPNSNQNHCQMVTSKVFTTSVSISDPCYIEV